MQNSGANALDVPPGDFHLNPAPESPSVILLGGFLIQTRVGITPMETSVKRWLRLKQVLQKVPYSKSQVYVLIRAGRFPAPVKIDGCKASFWLESEIDALFGSREG